MHLKRLKPDAPTTRCADSFTTFGSMTDVHNKATRSYNMSRIKGKNTKPELLVRKFLFAHGFRYRLNVKELPGKPDLVLPKYKTVIFINGCFWHGHKGCRYFVLPKTRTEWWLQKIKGTWQCDKDAEIKLNVLGWKVITVWGWDIKTHSLFGMTDVCSTVMRSYNMSRIKCKIYKEINFYRQAYLLLLV